MHDGCGIFIIMMRNTKRVWERIRKTKYRTGNVRRSSWMFNSLHHFACYILPSAQGLLWHVSLFPILCHLQSPVPCMSPVFPTYTWPIPPTDRNGITHLLIHPPPFPAQTRHPTVVDWFLYWLIYFGIRFQIDSYFLVLPPLVATVTKAVIFNSNSCIY